MIDHTKNLETVSEAAQKLGEEINRIQGILAQKREMYLKYLGIIEYLTSTEKPEETPEEDLVEPEVVSDELEAE